jgi:hypothetical protein
VSARSRSSTSSSGVIVAAFRDYLENLDRLKPIISAILAVLLWPLVLIGVDLRID